MEKIATDIYTFAELRNGGFTYVDKTDALYAMASGEFGKQFFIARPRRFGKSLAVSTLRALFEGRRELFRGLAVEPKWDWSKKWPVLHLDMGTMQYDKVEELEIALKSYFRSMAVDMGLSINEGDTLPNIFRNLIRDVAATSPDGKCVVLIDEYDKPLLKALNTPEVTKFRDFFKPFYGVVKYEEPKQRFAFITGVSKFSKVSIFSDLNNLNDWTMDARAATLFGYTHDEVKKCFPRGIHEVAWANGMTDEDAFSEILKWYDGYRFEENAVPVINPVSLGQCFQKRKFSNYWSKTAVPTFLIDILKRHPLNFASVDVTDDRLEAYEPENPDITTLLYQTGYLTIKSAQRLNDTVVYELCFPNREVANSFTARLVPAYVGMDALFAESATFEAARALYAHDVPRFLKALRAFFANIPYDLTDRQNEQTWQAIVYAVLRAMCATVNAEVRTNDGRMDMVVDLPNDIYIVEFKLDRPAAEAMEQMKGKDYAGKYALSGKRVTLVGISFSSGKRTIVEELVEEFHKQTDTSKTGGCTHEE
ncbi:MAG: ATP-binding protein [Kiritimatiellae bacterium]|nr:ATP-binding protein [Kiritimatiellia bacterium]